MLVKLGWRVLAYEGENWCQLVRQKYKVTEDSSWQFKSRQRETQIWKGVVWPSGLLREGLRWKIINGRSILFWSDKWIGDEPLESQRLRVLEDNEAERKFSDYWQDTRGWNWMELSQVPNASTLLKDSGDRHQSRSIGR